MLSLNLTPERNYTVPYNSNETITYHCEITTGEQAVWEIGGYIQLQDNTDSGTNIKMLFASNYSLFVEDIQTNESRLHVTQLARNSLLQQFLQQISCLPLNTFKFPDVIIPTRTIVTYGRSFYQENVLVYIYIILNSICACTPLHF